MSGTPRATEGPDIRIEGTSTASSGVPDQAHSRQLNFPIEIAKFWRNRKGEAVLVQLREYEGRVLVDARVYFTDPTGRLAPTKKGLSLTIKFLPGLCAALLKAERKARELGLLVEGD